MVAVVERSVATTNKMNLKQQEEVQMIRNIVRSFRFAPVVIAVLLAVQSAHAGPPLICHPFDIGDAKSLPWGGSAWRAVKADYDLNRLVEDTLALLSPNVPVIVRMETLRRATVYAVWAMKDREVAYAMKDPKVANELLSRLMVRARDAEAKGRPNAKAWFDVGYLAESYKQAGLATGLNGYALVTKGISLSGQDPEMEFAAALITLEGQREAHHKHLQRAVAGATDGSLLAKNLVSHFGNRGKTLAELRAKVGKPMH